MKQKMNITTMHHLLILMKKKKEKKGSRSRLGRFNSKKDNNYDNFSTNKKGRKSNDFFKQKRLW